MHSRKLVTVLLLVFYLQALVACVVIQPGVKATPQPRSETSAAVTVAPSTPVATSTASSQPESPEALATGINSDFLKRQFDPTAPYFETRPYPEEITSVSETDLVGMRCTKEYFSWTGADFSYVDETSNEQHELADPKLQAFVKSIQEAHPGEYPTSILSCETQDGRTIVFYRVGPCGGGCAGIPHFSYGQPDGTLELIALVAQEDLNGAYVGCYPAQLTKQDALYITCNGEGARTIRKIDLDTNSVSVVLRCQAFDGPVSCEPD